MNRKIKALGLALVASLAMSAMVASAAQGAVEFHSSAEHTILSGTQTTTHSFTVGSGFGNITCTTATFSGTGSAKTEPTQTITPTYSGCTDSVAGRTTHQTLHGEFRLTFSIFRWKISKSWTLKLTAGGGLGECNVEVVEQEPAGITYDNLGGTKGVQMTTNVTGIRSITSGGFFNCGTANGEHTEGTYNGTSVVTGVDTAGGAVELRVE